MIDRTVIQGKPLVGLAILAGIVYANAFLGAFQFDDSLTILENPHLHGWGTFVRHLDHAVRPVLYGTFLLDHSLYGNHPAGYHLLNLLLHVASSFLVYRILTRAVTKETPSVPFWTALLFLIHPITTETVTYISGRASGLMAFFYFLAFSLYIKASEFPHVMNVRRLYLSGAVVSYLLSFGSKETAMTFPLILLLWDLLMHRFKEPSFHAAVLSRHLPFWIVLLLTAGWAWSHPRYSALVQFSFTLRPLWDNFLSETHAVSYALSLFFCPWKQNFDHDLPEFHSLFQWPLPFDLLLLFGVAAAALVAARRLPLLSFGIGWFFVQLLPTSLIPRNDLLSERNLYLASLGLLLAIVVLCSRLAQWLTAVLPQPRVVRFGTNGAALALGLLLCFFTYQRNVLYRDEVSLWSDTVRKSPNKARPHNNLGHAYALQGNWEQAIEEFRIAAQLDPDYVLAQENLRKAYLHQVGRQ